MLRRCFKKMALQQVKKCFDKTNVLKNILEFAIRSEENCLFVVKFYITKLKFLKYIVLVQLKFLKVVNY